MTRTPKRSRLNRRLTRSRSQWQAERNHERRYLRLLLITPSYYRPRGTPHYRLGMWMLPTRMNNSPKRWSQVFP